MCVCVCGVGSHNKISLITVSTQQPYPILGCLVVLVFVKYMDLNKYILARQEILLSVQEYVQRRSPLSVQA